MCLFFGRVDADSKKERPALEKANETFRKRFSTIQSARFATSKGSRLRQIILRIITDARAERRRLQRAQVFPDLLKVIKPNEQLLALPELDNSPEAIERWTNVVVYPRLKKMARRLTADPVIGNMKKAIDENGKFQISRLKPLIRQTVSGSLPFRSFTISESHRQLALIGDSCAGSPPQAPLASRPLTVTN